MRPFSNWIKPPVSHMFNPGIVYKSQSGHTDIIVNTIYWHDSPVWLMDSGCVTWLSLPDKLMLLGSDPTELAWDWSGL